MFHVKHESGKLIESARSHPGPAAQPTSRNPAEPVYDPVPPAKRTSPDLTGWACDVPTTYQAQRIRWSPSTERRFCG